MLTIKGIKKIVDGIPEICDFDPPKFFFFFFFKKKNNNNNNNNNNNFVRNVLF